MVPGLGGVDSFAGLADYDGEASVGVDFLGKFRQNDGRAGGHECLGKFVKSRGDLRLGHGFDAGLVGEADDETLFRILQRRQYPDFRWIVSNFLAARAREDPVYRFCA